MKADALIQAAIEARANSYSPYSKYKVGSAVLMDNGQVYKGCNVENASYGGTVCAERVAIFNALSSGAKKIKSIAVVTDEVTPWPPCGFCRQVILEFADLKIPVYLANLNGKRIDLTLAELCPHPFKLT